MTDNIDPQEEVTSGEEKAAADTAFLLIKDWDGSWKASTDIALAMTIQRHANRNDVKTACRDIYMFLENSDIASIIASKLSEQKVSDTERAAQSVRQALSDRETS
jgi:hypothetical protein